MSGPLVTTTPGAPAGFFGKLPGQGDFLTRRLSADFLQIWDPWLQASVSESQTALGEAWLDAYLTSPIWRFVLTAGVAGQSPWAGLMMPSVDRVGRYFPLTVACPLPDGMTPLLALSSAADWFNDTQTLMLDALEGVMGVDELDARLLALPPAQIATSALAKADEPVACDTLGWRLALPDPRSAPDLMPGLLHCALSDLFFAYSLWWSEGSERVAPSLLVCQGLPSDPEFTTHYTGDWAAGQWWCIGDSSARAQRSDEQ
ncbi:MAG: type VI secretion system-associated protein TagF [Thiohalocapsa sp.]